MTMSSEFEIVYEPDPSGQLGPLVVRRPGGHSLGHYHRPTEAEDRVRELRDTEEELTAGLPEGRRRCSECREPRDIELFKPTDTVCPACHDRRRAVLARHNTILALRDEAVPAEGMTWKAATVLDGDVLGDLCWHEHPTEWGAERCAAACGHEGHWTMEAIAGCRADRWRRVIEPTIRHVDTARLLDLTWKHAFAVGRSHRFPDDLRHRLEPEATHLLWFSMEETPFPELFPHVEPFVRVTAYLKLRREPNPYVTFLDVLEEDWLDLPGSDEVPE